MSPATKRKRPKKPSTVRLTADARKSSCTVRLKSARTKSASAVQITSPASASAMKDRVAAYFAALPAAARQRMRQVRQVVVSVAPDAVEWFSYGVPGFRLHDRPFVWYAAFNEHVSLFPMTGAIRTAFARELDGYETSKGTVRFPHDRPLPATLIKRLVKARLNETLGDA